MSPKVSVCIPCYNGRAFLAEALESIAKQTFVDWEIVVVEDGSPDPSGDIVEAFARDLPQPVRYLPQENNRGLPATRNHAIAAASGEWIALLDADDVWKPDHLADLVDTADEQTLDFVHSGSEVFDSEDGRTLYTRHAQPCQSIDGALEIFRSERVVQPSSVLFRKSVFEAIGGFDPKWPCCADLDYWLRIVEAGFRFSGTDATTSLYRKHEGAMSMKMAALIAESGRVRRRFSSWSDLPAFTRMTLPARDLFNAARMLYRKHPVKALLLTFESAATLACCAVRVVVSTSQKNKKDVAREE